MNINNIKNNANKEKKIIKKQQKNFEKFLSQIETIKDEEYKYDLATYAAFYATHFHTGYYYSTKLEKIFTDYAKTINTQLSSEYKPDTFLHVMTTALISGGHTRVVEKWIEQAPIYQTHSVICINQRDLEIPKKLKDAITLKNGKLILLDTGNLKEKAIQLREIASNYEYIILHIHMDDPTALVAFGTEDFKRPIVFYNHADHMFWLGKSITDKLASLREYADTVTIPKRNITDSFMLGVPAESKINPIIDKNLAKKKLGLDLNTKLIVSAGGSHKYTPMSDNSFVNYLLNITKENNNIQIIIIGPSQQEKIWGNAYRQSNGIIKAVGQINYDNGYFDYMNAADLVIDSWPMSGGTVMIDAISCNTPVLSLKNPIGQFDYLAKSKAYCQNEEELYAKAKLILNNEQFRKDLLNEVKNNFEEDHSVENWSRKLEQLIQITPKTHTIKDLSSEIENKDIDEAAIVLNYLYNPTFINKKCYKKYTSLILYYIAKYILHNKKLSYKYLKKRIKYPI